MQSNTVCIFYLEATLFDTKPLYCIQTKKNNIMQQYEFGWKNPSGISIFAQGWLPNESPKAIIILIHGLGEHSSRYEHVAEYFTAKGIGILANDRSGHGKSANKRGHVNKYEEVYDDITKLVQEAKTKYPNIPLILYGHSMGGGIVLDYLLHQNTSMFKAIIATSPLLRPAFQPPAFLLFLGKMLRSIFPGFTQDNQLDVNNISRDKNAVAKYQKDGLVHSKVTSEMAIGMLNSGENSLATVGKINKPLLLTHGTADELTSHKATQEFANKAQGDVTIKLWDGFYHELHNEPEKIQVLDYIYNWIMQKL